MILSESDIIGIYQKYILSKNNSDYLNRYEILPENPNKNWDWNNKDFPRVISILEFKKYIDENKLEFNKILTFNGADDPEYEHLTYKEKINYNYVNDKINYDLHNLNLPVKDFDFVMANQTLEHVYDPVKVVRNLYDHLSDGGIIYMNLPAVNIPHSTPFHHFTGITPVGLGCIFKSAGFEILDIGFWGNSSYHNFIFNHKNDWPDYKQITDYRSDIDRPVITWIFAKKIK